MDILPLNSILHKWICIAYRCLCRWEETHLNEMLQSQEGHLPKEKIPITFKKKGGGAEGSKTHLHYSTSLNINKPKCVAAN